jgi:hypothetical protein
VLYIALLRPVESFLPCLGQIRSEKSHLWADSEDEPQRRKEESSSKFNKRYDLWVTRHPDKVGRRSKREYNEVAEMHYSENEEDDEDFDEANDADDDDVGVRAEDLDEDGFNQTQHEKVQQ